MRYYVLLPFIILFSFSCQRVDDDNADDFESTGEIIGQDLTLCACCGGFIIKFDDIKESFLFSEVPSESDVDLSSLDFPVKIRANWTEGVSEPCPSIITIEEMELVE